MMITVTLLYDDKDGGDTDDDIHGMMYHRNNISLLFFRMLLKMKMINGIPLLIMIPLS